MNVIAQVLKRVWSHPGNADDRGRAIARAVGWQVHKRTSRKPREVDFAEGFTVICHPDSGSASNIFYGNKYFDVEEMRLIRRVLRPGDGFVDAGANIGVYSMLAAALVGPKGRVIAFEPFATHTRRFQENADRNGFAQVTLHREALSDAPGEVKFVTTRDVSNRIQTRTDADADTVTVPCTTLDARLPEDTRFVIGKMDLEGSEIAAMRGATRTLATANPPVWEIEWNPGLFRKRGHDPQELVALLNANGFELSAVEGDRLVAAIPPDRSGNILAVHRGYAAELERRLSERTTLPPTRW